MNRTVVAFGGNLPFRGQPPSHTFAAALTHLTTHLGHRLRGVARLWRSRPVHAEGPDFLNTVAWIDTPLAPEDWLKCLLETEHLFGRQRPDPAAFGLPSSLHDAGQAHHPARPSAARTLDLDLIWVEGQTLQTAMLSLPHPRAASRAFVLGPLCDLEHALADLRLLCPGTGQPRSVSALWAELPATARADLEPTGLGIHWPTVNRPAAAKAPVQESDLA